METNSLKVFGNPEFNIVGTGLAHKESAIYYCGNSQAELFQYLKDEDIPLIAHNLFYDGSCIARCLGSVRGFDAPGWLNWKFDTFSLLRFLSNEDFPGQRYSLKYAMENLLLWEDTNEAKRDDWLLSHGFIKGPLGVLPTDNEEVRHEKIVRIIQGLRDSKTYKINKGLMYLCPPDILGEYCNLDAYATYQLHREILLPAVHKYTTDYFVEFQQGPWMTLIRNCIDNYQVGVNIDVKRLERYKGKLTQDIEKAQRKIQKAYRKEITKLNRELYKKFIENTTPKAKTKSHGIKLPDKVPAKYTKSGSLTKTWISYQLKVRRKRRVEALGNPYSSNYMKWRKKRRDLKLLHKGKLPPFDTSFSYNPNSPDHKRSILYDGVDVTTVRPHLGKDWDKKGRIKIRDIPIDMTDSGLLPTGKQAVLAIGGKATLFDNYNKLLKKKQFTASVLSRVDRSTGRLHPMFKVPGTATLRLSGDGGINFQNLCGDEEFLRCWITSSPDYFVMSDDFKSLEPFVFTEASRDKAMLQLYGPGAPDNDVYIFTAALIGGLLGQPFLDCGYVPDNPTKESISKCKQFHKKIRNAAKVLTLSGDYGAGAYKKWVTLKLQGFNYTLEEVQDMHARQQEVYGGKVAFAKKLQREVEKNKGWMLDMLGFPIATNPSKLKDLPNKCVQRSGHLCLVLLQYKITMSMWEERVDYNWIINDLHDDLIPEIHKKDIEKVKRICDNSIQWLNDFLKPMAKLVATPEFSDTLAGIKIENYEPEDQDIQELLEEFNT